MHLLAWPTEAQGGSSGYTHEHWARHLYVVPRPMPAAPRRYFILMARRLPAAVVCHRYLIVVPRPLPAAAFLVRRRFLIVVPRPVPAAPLAVRRTYLAVVLGGAVACFCRQAHVLAVVAPPAPAAQSASGVDAPLSICTHVLDRDAQAGAQTIACRDRRRALCR